MCIITHLSWKCPINIATHLTHFHIYVPNVPGSWKSASCLRSQEHRGLRGEGGGGWGMLTIEHVMGFAGSICPSLNGTSAGPPVWAFCPCIMHRLRQRLSIPNIPLTPADFCHAPMTSCRSLCLICVDQMDLSFGSHSNGDVKSHLSRCDRSWNAELDRLMRFWVISLIKLIGTKCVTQSRIKLMTIINRLHLKKVIKNSMSNLRVFPGYYRPIFLNFWLVSKSDGYKRCVVPVNSTQLNSLHNKQQFGR